MALYSWKKYSPMWHRCEKNTSGTFIFKSVYFPIWIFLSLAYIQWFHFILDNQIDWFIMGSTQISVPNLWVSFFCWTQKTILYNIYLVNAGNPTVEGTHWLLIMFSFYGRQWVPSTVWLPTFFKYIFFFCSTEERHSYRFGTTWKHEVFGWSKSVL